MTEPTSPQPLPSEQQAPERIWLLKSVISLLGTSDFNVPPHLRSGAVEYVRADLCEQPKSEKQQIKEGMLDAFRDDPRYQPGGSKYRDPNQDS